MARKNILVVDDEKSQREILEMILTEEGYDVTTAASGEAAIKFAKDRRFDLALALQNRADHLATDMKGRQYIALVEDIGKLRQGWVLDGRQLRCHIRRADVEDLADQDSE